jgi:ectoine hydroxylase-related dioxygenase (phytanoyl-CoA dioxygenase family)
MMNADAIQEEWETMTPEEKFLFDLQGYLVIKNVLTPAEVAELNATFDEKLRPVEATTDQVSRQFTRWGPPFQALIDHPKIVPYLVELIDPRFRLDHDFYLVMRAGDPGTHLHGGDWIGYGDHYYRYRDGVMRNGLCVVIHFLAPAAAGDGGFGCIPGSHKSYFIDAIPPEVRRFERAAPYVIQPAVEAGDALIFTEALVHGTMAWHAQHERRALLFKYGPGNSTCHRDYYDLGEFEYLTERQRRILAPAYERSAAGGRPNVLEPEA